MDTYECRWCITYLATDARLSAEERTNLVVVATEMYLKKTRRKEVKTDVYEGIVSTTGEYQVLGIYGGQRFSAQIETDHGKSRLEFLVMEKINPRNN